MYTLSIPYLCTIYTLHLNYFICIVFLFSLGDKCEIIKISQPIKSHWAQEKNLNLNELLSDGEYKEQHRLDMIKWSEEMRERDYGCFCRAACQNGNFNCVVNVIIQIMVISR